MNALAISGFFTGITCLFLALLILRYGTSEVQRSFGLQNFAIALWGFGNGLAGLAKTPASAALAWKVALVGGFFIIPLLLNHVLILNNLYRKRLLAVLYVWAALYPVLCLIGIDDMRVTYIFGSFYQPELSSWLYATYYAIWVAMALYVSVLVISGYLKAQAENRTAMLLYAVAYIGGVWGGGTYVFMTSFGINLLYPYGNFLITVYCAVITYAIFRHKLFDIQVIIRKTLVFAGLFFAVFIFLLLPTFVLQERMLNSARSFFSFPPCLANYVWSLSSMLIAVTCFVLCIMSLKYGTRKLKYTWALFNIAAGTWGLGAFFAGMAPNQHDAMIAWKIGMFGSILAPAVFYQLCTLYGEVDRRGHVVIFYIYCFVMYAFCIFNLSGIRINYLYQSIYYVQAVDYRWFVLCLLWSGIIIFSLYELYKIYQKIRSDKKVQAQYLLFAYVIGWSGALINILPFFNIVVFPVGNLFIWIYCMIVAYAIIKHKLMDITVVIKKTIVFGGALIAVLILLILPAVLMQEYLLRQAGTSGRLIGLTISGIVIILTMRRLEAFLIEITDRYLFQKKYDYKELLKTFTSEVLTVMDLTQLVDLTASKLQEIMRIESCDVVLSEEAQPALPSSMPVIPIEFSGKKIGYLALGKKKSDEPFTQDDMDILLPLVRTLGIAISNARLLEELSKTQAEAAQKEKMAMLGTLAAGMAHEIRNPITTIKTFSEFLPERKDDPQFIEKFQKLVPKEIDKIDHMITHLLEFSAPADYRSIENVDINEAARDVLDILKNEMVLNDIMLEEDLGEVPMVSGNKKYVQEVLFNVLQNAIHAIGRRGRIRLEVKMDGPHVLVAIKDTGCGIPEKNLNHIFEPFFTTKISASGVGLGLYVIKQLMSRMGGDISAESSEGKGSTFYLRFAAVKKVT